MGQGVSMFDVLPEAGQEVSMGYAAKTANGYDLDIVASALQKAVRRGREREALYWAHEMWATGFVAYFWRRLVLIAHEECGSDLSVSMFVGTAAANARLASKEFKGRVEGIIESHAVLVCCRAEKSREACDAMVAVRHAKEELNWRIEPHPSAVDKHTRAGRRAGKTATDFRTEGRLVAGRRGPNAYEVDTHGARQPDLPRPEDPRGEPDVTIPPRVPVDARKHTESKRSL